MEPGPISEVEVIEPARQGRRRRFTAEEKRKIVEETAVPGQSVSSVSRRYGVSPSQVFKWRRLVDEERTVDGTEPMPGSVSGQGGQLLAECQVLGDEARPRAESRDERADDGLDQRQHHSSIATPGALVIGESESRIGYAGPPPRIPSTAKRFTKRISGHHRSGCSTKGRLLP